MLFYLIRILVVVALVFLFIAISKKRKWKFNKLKIFLVILSSLATYVLLFLFPIESSFLRFETIEQAFNYSAGGEMIQNKIEEKDCAFIISQRSENSTSLHTVTKHDQKWGMMDTASTSSPFIPSNNTILGNVILSASCISNNEKEKTLVVVRILSSNEFDEGLKITNERGDEFILLDQQIKNNIFSAEFYRVEKGEIPTEFEVYLNNKGENEKISFAKAS